MYGYDGPTRWVADNDLIIELVHLSGTGNTTGPMLRSARARDGWTLVTKSPHSGFTVSETHLPDLGHRNPNRALNARVALDAALKAVNAVPTGRDVKSRTLAVG